MTEQNVWRRCGSCKKPINLKAKYYACGISSCKKSAYCSMPCFDDHSPIFRHKDAWAEERLAPSILDGTEEQPSRLATAHLTKALVANDNSPKDILVVASKLKDYIRHKSGMNTSANVLERLSDMMRVLSDRAIERAHNDNRKTVMDRDFLF